MPNYYELRRMAIRDIDEMLSRRVPKDSIKLEITERYGFNGKVVDERIDQHLRVKGVSKRGR